MTERKESIYLIIAALPKKPTFEDIEGKVKNSIFEETLQDFPVLVEDDNRNLLDLRLLYEEQKYQQIINFRPAYEKHPRQEFAELLNLANREIGQQILGMK